MRIRAPYKINSAAIDAWLDSNSHSRWWIADQLGVHPNTIVNWFEGKTVPDKPMLGQISILTGLDQDELTTPRTR